jgi:hypothetical protein
MPHFKPSEYSLEIVGEKSYQKAIKEISMYKDLVEKDDLDFKLKGFTASLILEDENKFDPGNAVRVDIDGQIVGYLDKRNAEWYRDQLSKLGIPKETCTCKASIFGKREAPGKPMFIGVWLNIDLKQGLEIELPKPPRKKLFGIF